MDNSRELSTVKRKKYTHSPTSLLVLAKPDDGEVNTQYHANSNKEADVRQENFRPVRSDGDPETQKAKLHETDLPPRQRRRFKEVHIYSIAFLPSEQDII